MATIRPQLGALQESDITVPTIRGPITGSFRNVNPRLQTFDITIPANMVAEFSLPLEENQVMTLDGEAVNPAFPSLRLGPGRHRIEVQVNSF